jgi:hypothetical protein
MGKLSQYCLRLRWLVLLAGAWFLSLAALRLVDWRHGNRTSPFMPTRSTLLFATEIVLAYAGNLTWQFLSARAKAARSTEARTPFTNPDEITGGSERE